MLCKLNKLNTPQIMHINIDIVENYVYLYYDVVSGKTDRDLFLKNIAEEFENNDKKIFSAKSSIAIDEYHYFSNKIPIFDKDGHVRGLLGISIDITERKQLEEKLQKANILAAASNQLKTEFIENMQHDIRTPISGIWSMLDSMVKSKDLQSFAKMLPYMLSASKELLEICNEVIDFENATYGDKPLYSRKFSLLNMIHSASAIAHQNSIELKIDENVPDIIKGDDYRLKKILINLIGNVVKFNENGNVYLYVEKIKGDDKQVTLRFHIKDNGIGIPSDKLDTIFEKFTKLTPSNTGKFKGTGLGLHIVKKFSSEINAELDVVSTEGKRTELTLDAVFDLPLVEKLVESVDVHASTQMRHLLINPQGQIGEAETSAVEQATHDIPTKTTTPLEPQNATRVILIEDDNIAMMVAESRFKGASRPCQVFKAENVADALLLLKTQKVDLVVSDIGLPDGTGFDIIEAVKRDSNHINYQTPFVALTAHSDDVKKERAKQAGFLALYNKPLLQQHADKILADFTEDNSLVDNQEAVDIIMSQKITGADKETVIKLLNVLISSFTKDKSLFEIAFHNNDFKSARELFHKFRKVLSYIRAPEVERLAKELHEEVKELEAQQGNLQSLKPKLDKLINAVDNVELWLKQLKA